MNEAIKRFIREHMNDLADDLAGGGATSFEDYKFKTGIVHGLAMVEREILDLEERYRTADD